MIPSSEIDVMNAERRIACALAHPAFSDWLKQALHTALDRDPLALANDLELLGHLLRPWSQARLARDADTGRPPHFARGELPEGPPAAVNDPKATAQTSQMLLDRTAPLASG